MPTNLPPDYFAVERRFREAETTPEKIALLEEMMGTIPKHKGTDHLRAELRRKLAKLKSEPQTKKGATRHASTYHIPREGAGQVVLIGPTNTGKSALLRALTNAVPDVSAAPFTTWEPTPGMMPFEDIQVQLVDTPPLNPDHTEPELFNLLRRADLILLLVDVTADPLRQLADASAKLEEHRLAPVHREGRYSEESRMVFKPILVLANRCDDEERCEDFEILKALVDEPWPMLAVSALSGHNLDEMKRWIFQQLRIIRIYSKAPGKEPDLAAPYALKVGSTIDDLAARVHRDFHERLKQARVWGSAEFPGQPVGRDYVLHDRDIVELRV